MRTCVFIAFFIVMLIYIVINISAITKTINGDSRNANGYNKLQSSSNNKNVYIFSSKTTTTTTMGISKTIATKNNETLLSLMTAKLMTAHKIEISTAKPSNFNKNSLRQRKGQQAGQQQQQEQQKQQQQQQQLLPQQRHYKHQYTLDNKHPPCDYVEHASSVVTSGSESKTNANTIISNTANNTNLDNNTRFSTTSAQIDATAKGYKPLTAPKNTSNSVDTNNNGINKPLLNLLSASTSSPSSTFNVARNDFRDKINISNQRNEFTTKVDDVDDVHDGGNNADDDDGADDDDETDKHDNVTFKMKVQVMQSASRTTVEKYNTNIKNGLSKLNSNINSASYGNNSVNNYVVPAASSFFEHVELVESSLSPDKRHELLLHRRKRYLVFPEGSSFQLVFDLIIGIVDYTSYAILGITCSVAWELPNKPPSEIIENFRDKLNEGTFGIQRRNDSTADKELQYVENQSKSKTPTETTTTTTTTHFTNFEYENAWKPQKYVPTNYYQQQKYVPRVKADMPTVTSYYGYKTRNEYGKYDGNDAVPAAASVLDMTGGTGLAEAQRKTLNDKAAQWQSLWNRPKIDKTNTKYDKNYSTKQNYEWRGNDKWTYIPYVATADWHRQRMRSNSNDNHDNHDDYNADNVNYDERQQQQQQQQQQQKNYENWRKKHNWWHSSSQHWIDKQKKWAKYGAQNQNWNSYTPKEPITAYASPTYEEKPQNYARTGRQRQVLKEPPKHRIYPVFGRRKRSLENKALASPFEIELERIHFREQLQSRQKLYGKIEQLFQTRGHNGTACVLRALCETGQRHQLPLHHRQFDQRHSTRHHDHQEQEPHSTTAQQNGPQSFITELLRAIFALPKDIRSREFKSEALHSDSQSHAGRPSSNSSSRYSTNDDDMALELLQREFEKHISWHYRDAHAYTGHCAERFASCEHSIWNDGIRHGGVGVGVVGRAFKM